MDRVNVNPILLDTDFSQAYTTSMANTEMTAPLSQPMQPTRWHQLLGKVLELLLTEQGIIVQTEVQVMSEPPKADILLLRREHKAWSKAQQALLPDGVRASKARHILLEFKYTQSLTLDVLLQAVSYSYLYRIAQRLQPADVQIFVLCAKTPQPKRLAELGYVQTAEAGVYSSNNTYVRDIPLLILNKLRDEPHNAFVKCFASRKSAKGAAFKTLTQGDFTRLPGLLWIFLIGLRRLWTVPEGAELMNETLTPERVLEMGEQWHKLLLEQMSVEERLAGLRPKEVLAQYTPEEVLAQYTPEEVLAELPLERIEAWIQQQRAKSMSLDEAPPSTNPVRNN